jgi:hypothetical protein
MSAGTDRSRPGSHRRVGPGELHPEPLTGRVEDWRGEPEPVNPAQSDGPNFVLGLHITTNGKLHDLHAYQCHISSGL